MINFFQPQKSSPKKPQDWFFYQYPLALIFSMGFFAVLRCIPQKNNILLTDKVKIWLDGDPEGRKGLQRILRHPKDGGRNGLLYKAHVKIIDPSERIVVDEKQVKPYQFSEDEIKDILD